MKKKELILSVGDVITLAYSTRLSKHANRYYDYIIIKQKPFRVI